MTRDEYIKTFERYANDRIELIKKKSKDYARDTNPFSNFEMISRIANVSVEKVFMMFLGVKIARLENLLNSGHKPENESITDTLMDLSNYSEIFRAYLEKKQEVK